MRTLQMTEISEELASGILSIDTEYGRPRMDAAYLIVDNGRAAYIDTGTYFSVPNLLTALSNAHLSTDDVDYIFLTHIHLDHAGGASRLAAAIPRAVVVVHPRGSPHLVDPQKLFAATKAVHGERGFAQQYGEITAIPKERIVAVTDGQQFQVGKRVLQVIDTPGHAMHHICIADRDAEAVFTGDTFGVSYREFDISASAFIFPTTSPSQFDPEPLRASVSRIMALQPRSLYLTHYSRVNYNDQLGLDLHGDIDAFVEIAKRAAGSPDRVKTMTAQIFDHLSARLDAHGFDSDSALRHSLLDFDAGINAAGLDAWLSRIR
jgi:glyoxylase-like metal-dependent hydrolase (beta-lactamase superfamily II)